MIIYVTDVSKFSTEEIFFDHICQITRTNLEYLQLRFKGFNKSRNKNLILKTSNLIKSKNLKIIVNEDYETCNSINAFGYHIPSFSELNGKNAKKFSGASWISKSIHTKKELLKYNNDKYIDSFVLGTIFKSNSHPDGNVLGINNLRKMIDLSNKPIIAIGGINSTNLNLIVKAGAKGAAIITDIANAKNINSKIKKLNSFYD